MIFCAVSFSDVFIYLSLRRIFFFSHERSFAPREFCKCSTGLHLNLGPRKTHGCNASTTQTSSACFISSFPPLFPLPSHVCSHPIKNPSGHPKGAKRTWGYPCRYPSRLPLLWAPKTQSFPRFSITVPPLALFSCDSFQMLSQGKSRYRQVIEDILRAVISRQRRWIFLVFNFHRLAEWDTRHLTLT